MQETKLLTFSEVLEGLKEGKRYQRKGWNGKGLCVTIHNVPGIQPFFLIVDAAKLISNTWVPSISDLLAEDWIEWGGLFAEL